MLTTLLPLASLEVVIITTLSGTSDYKVVNVITKYLYASVYGPFHA